MTVGIDRPTLVREVNPRMETPIAFTPHGKYTLIPIDQVEVIGRVVEDLRKRGILRQRRNGSNSVSKPYVTVPGEGF